jgi:hypothetical protein
MRRFILPLAAALGACTDAGTDPDAVLGLRFDGSSYPSIVAGDSLRDSLGNLQPLLATAFNYKGDPVEGATVVFSSPDTVLQMLEDGGVFARARKPDGTPARVYATIGVLQSQPDSLFTVPRADSIRPDKGAQTIVVTSTLGGVSPADSLPFVVLGDTAAVGPKAFVPAWLVSFQLRYRGTLLSPADTTVAYTFFATTGANARRVPSSVDTTDVSGKAARAVFVRSISVTEDTIYVIATIRQRKLGTPARTAQTMILLRPQ